MKYCLSVISTLLLAVSPAVSQTALSSGTNYNIAVNMKSGSLNFGETALMAYTIKDADRILSVITTNYDFYKTSLEISLSRFDTNTFIISVSSYEVSNFLIPSFFVVSMEGGATNRFFTPEIPVDCKAIQGTQQELLPIMEIYDFPDWFWLVWVAAGLALAAGIFLIVRALLARRTPERTKPKDPYEYAIRRLKDLRAQNLAQTAFKEYFGTISEIDREFLENVLNFQAMEMSTSEIHDWLKSEQTDEELTEVTMFILKLSDHVKYAKHVPTDENIERVYQELYHIVERMKMIKTLQTPEEGEST